MFTQDDLDRLKEALISGAESVTIGDRNIKFRSKDDLLELIDLVQNQLDGDDVDGADLSSVVVGGFRKKPEGI